MFLHMVIRKYFLYLYLHLYLFNTSIKPQRTVLFGFFFNCLTQVYLVKTTVSHNKYLTLQFLEDDDHISGKSTAQILSLNLV